MVERIRASLLVLDITQRSVERERERIRASLLVLDVTLCTSESYFLI